MVHRAKKEETWGGRLRRGGVIPDELAVIGTRHGVRRGQVGAPGALAHARGRVF